MIARHIPQTLWTNFAFLAVGVACGLLLCRLPESAERATLSTLYIVASVAFCALSVVTAIKGVDNEPAGGMRLCPAFPSPVWRALAGLAHDSSARLLLSPIAMARCAPASLTHGSGGWRVARLPWTGDGRHRQGSPSCARGLLVRAHAIALSADRCGCHTGQAGVGVLDGREPCRAVTTLPARHPFRPVPSAGHILITCPYVR